MWEFLRELNAMGTTIILTTHYLEEAESLCRNIAIIDKGSIIQSSSTRDLIKRLQMETFVLDSEQSISEAPVLEGYNTRLVDAHSFELQVQKGQSLNGVFEQLAGQGLNIVSMRNKANRLEELFVSLVSRQEGAA